MRDLSGVRPRRRCRLAAALAAAALLLGPPAAADMAADSPVRFPKDGPLPAADPPDRPARAAEEPEKGYAIFGTPERSLGQIARIQARMPRGQFAPPPTDWRHLPRTRRALARGGDLRVLAVGDSIVADAMRSGWVASLGEAYPAARITAAVYVRGGGGCQDFKEADRVRTHIAPRRPDLVLLGGISQRDTASVREVVRQLRRDLPAVEVVLLTGAFGPADPRVPKELAAARYSGTGAYGAALRELAAAERCGFLDMTAPWAEYVRTSGVHPHRFYRDPIHANEYGEQVLGKVLMAFWSGAKE